MCELRELVVNFLFVITAIYSLVHVPANHLSQNESLHM